MLRFNLTRSSNKAKDKSERREDNWGSLILTWVSYVFYYLAGDITRERHQQRMLSFATASYIRL